jgi:hypothetical protein
LPRRSLGRGLKRDRQARGGKQEGGKEVGGGFVVTRGDASEVLEFIEEALDEIALSVEGAVDRALDLAVRTGRDVSSAAAASDQIDKGARVIAAIGDEIATGLELLDQDWGDGLVGNLALQLDRYDTDRMIERYKALRRAS